MQSEGFLTGVPSLSADGRFVAFESDASDLVPGITIDLPHVFVYDRQSGVTTWVSPNGNGDHLNPILSGDGNFIAFSSDSDTLVVNDTNDVRDAFLYERQTGSITRLSLDPSGGQGDADSGGFTKGITLSADGNVAAFETAAQNLAPQDMNEAQDILVRDLGTGQTTLGSVSDLPVEGNGPSGFASVSANDRFVAFSSMASNLVAGDTNDRPDVFVLDLQTNQLTRVSVDTQGVQGNDASAAPALSADGRFVVFESDASNLTPGDNNQVSDIFVHDRDTGTTTRMTVDANGADANDMSFGPAISADGRFVAFTSYATNLVPNDLNMSRDVFVRDRQTGVVRRISIADQTGAEGNGESDNIRFSGDGRFMSSDGRFVAFTSEATNLVPGDTNNFSDVFVHDLTLGRTIRVSIDSNGGQGDDMSFAPALSADGRFVAFTSYAKNLVSGDTNAARDVFVHDIQAGSTTRVSVNMNGDEGNNESGDVGGVSLSADGRFVAFISEASNLAPNDTNTARDVFVYDRQTGEIRLVSAGLAHMAADGRSSGPAMAPSGRVVVFQSEATDLVTDDGNPWRDIFIATLRIQ